MSWGNAALPFLLHLLPKRLFLLKLMTLQVQSCVFEKEFRKISHEHRPALENFRSCSWERTISSLNWINNSARCYVFFLQLAISPSWSRPQQKNWMNGHFVKGKEAAFPKEHSAPVQTTHTPHLQDFFQFFVVIEGMVLFLLALQTVIRGWHEGCGFWGSCQTDG